ncbi:MAG: hypothetical protein RSB76_02800 [Clostridia bacterium]
MYTTDFMPYNSMFLNNTYRKYTNPYYNEELITLNQAIELIKMSIENEKEDQIFYDSLIKLASTDKEKSIISSIRNDETKHNQILKNIYFDFTSMMFEPQENVENENISQSYSELLEKALFGETDAIAKYRKIMSAMQDEKNYALIMAIMTDEIRHANKYNYLIAKQK